MSQARPRQFAFVRQPGGWRTLEYPHHEGNRLDEAFLHAFIDRTDAASDKRLPNAALLYLADDWSVTVTDPQQAGAAPKTLNRLQYTAALAAARNMPPSNHRREILKLTIAADGASAGLESREYEDVSVDGKLSTVVSHTTDKYELHGNIVVVSRSTAEIERTEPKAP